MINVAALTSGKNTPSTRFRIRQHIGPLKKAGIHVREYLPLIDKYAPLPNWPKKGVPKLYFGNSRRSRPKYNFGTPSLIARAIWKCVKIPASLPGVVGSQKARITWLERAMTPGLLIYEPFLKRPYIFDVDDAIWLTPPLGRFAVSRIAKRAEIVLAGNPHIADWFSPFARDIRIVPTAVDTDRIQPWRLRRPSPAQDSRTIFRIGWTGTSANYPYLLHIEEALENFLKDHDAELVIVAEHPPKFSRLPEDKVRYVRWTRESEVDILKHIDVGIMPLSQNEWSLGKCSFKMLQYMAAGVPVVVSPVGMNRDVLSLGEVGVPAETASDWYSALAAFYEDRSLGDRCGAAGRSIVKTHFSHAVVSQLLADIFKELA